MNLKILLSYMTCQNIHFCIVFLISSIPKEWKTKLRAENTKLQKKETLLSKMLKAKQTNRFLYDYQLRKEFKIPIKPEKKWETIFNNIELNWKFIYTLPFKTTIDTKMREFQYKYIMRINLILILNKEDQTLNDMKERKYHLKD